MAPTNRKGLTSNPYTLNVVTISNFNQRRKIRILWLLHIVSLFTRDFTYQHVQELKPGHPSPKTSPSNQKPNGSGQTPVTSCSLGKGCKGDSLLYFPIRPSVYLTLLLSCEKLKIVRNILWQISYLYLKIHPTRNVSC